MSGEEGYPHIVMSGTDPNLPEGLPAGFAKYSQFKPMAKGGWDCATRGPSIAPPEAAGIPFPWIKQSAGRPRL